MQRSPVAGRRSPVAGRRSPLDITNVAPPNARGLNDDQREILAQVDRFAHGKLYPLAQRMDDEERWPPDVFRWLGKQAYLGVTAPAELGGSALDFLSACLVVQGIARWNHAIGLAYATHENLCLGNILANASAEQLRRYVPEMIEGRTVGALALTEPGASSDAIGGMSTTARCDGDDYLLDGSKLFITNGPIADVILVYAKTAPERGAHGISAFLVEPSFEGFAVAQKMTKMGFRGSQTAELVFDCCRVPAANLVGRENQGIGLVMNGLDRERVGIAFLALGMAERAFELMVVHARDRKQFGQEIGRFQLIRLSRLSAS